MSIKKYVLALHFWPTQRNMKMPFLTFLYELFLKIFKLCIL